ncbi:hypothetical protein C5N14_28900 [Micromonospora sp. MW-13]|nr:hypothetical protein C5N14_28900 [Micromonospora sp. MW-13]
MDETSVKVNGVWRYVYRAVDQYGQVIDVLVSARRDAAAARRFFHRALTTVKVTPTEVVTDAAPVYPDVLDDLVPPAWHHVERYANNLIQADHSQLKHRRPCPPPTACPHPMPDTCRSAAPAYGPSSAASRDSTPTHERPG